jgi:hypothetical protein
MRNNRAEGLSFAQRTAELRLAFQERIGVHGAEPWTVTEEESEQMLGLCPVSLLLEGFSKAAKEIRKLKDESLVYLDQEHALNLVHQKIALEIAAAEKHREQRTRQTCTASV